jgi:phosphoadenosine phosphosulfate reductase
MIIEKASGVNLGKARLPDLEKESPQERFAWAVRTYPEKLVLTTSFGAQSAAFLHLATQAEPDLPIIFIDTGYHFQETLEFAQQLTKQLGLKVQTYRPLQTPADIEKKHGRLWEMGADGMEKFHEIIRVEPLRRAMKELNPLLWIAGLRRTTAASRKELSILSHANSRIKMLPILDWTDRQVGEYLQQHSLPYHPLWAKGYVSIGDRVTTKRLDEVTDPAELRHFGGKRECGIHEKV